MKFYYFNITAISLALLASCDTKDKTVENSTPTDGPKVVIDSTGLKNAGTANNAMPIATTQPAMQTTLVNNTGQVQQQVITQQPQQNVQVASVPVQQQIQQQLQQQMLQQQAKPQVVQTTQQSAHPQFTDVEFKALQEDAKKRGIGLNPAHGQPGHRCDIYVGQPLDSKPVAGLGNTQQATPTTTTPAPQTITATPQPVQVAAGMNPAHGQPGHRCDIEVGKPLNSKPIATPAATTINATPTAATDSAKGSK